MKWYGFSLIGVCGWVGTLCAQPVVVAPGPGLDVPPEPAKPITLDIPAWREKLSSMGGPLWLQYLPDVRLTVETPGGLSTLTTMSSTEWLRGMEILSPLEGVWIGYRFPEIQNDGRPAATLSIKHEF